MEGVLLPSVFKPFEVVWFYISYSIWCCLEFSNSHQGNLKLQISFKWVWGGREVGKGFQKSRGLSCMQPREHRESSGKVEHTSKRLTSSPCMLVPIGINIYTPCNTNASKKVQAKSRSRPNSARYINLYLCIALLRLKGPLISLKLIHFNTLQKWLVAL